MEPSRKSELFEKKQSEEECQSSPNEEKSGQYNPDSENQSEGSSQTEMENDQIVEVQCQIKPPTIQNDGSGKKTENYKSIKKYEHQIDPRYLHGIDKLCRREIISLMKKGEGIIFINRMHTPNSIQINYYEEEVLDRVIENLEDFIDNVEVMKIDKKDVEKGYHLSRNYQKKLREEKMVIFKFIAKKGKVKDYYICGRVDKEQLREKVYELKRSNFTWLSLFEYASTRSYKIVLQKIFEMMDFKKAMLKELNAVNIEICIPKEQKDFKHPKKRNYDNIEIILTLLRRNRLIHQSVDEFITKFIKTNYSVVCFNFKRQKLSEKPTYLPKIEGVTMFFVHEHHNCFSYLFLLFEKKKIELQVVIDEIQQLKLNIIGRRFFRGFSPEFRRNQLEIDMYYWRYPYISPYSWTIKSKIQGQVFNWQQQLRKSSDS